MGKYYNDCYGKNKYLRFDKTGSILNIWIGPQVD
jgi:hypothetical protein